jgi:hypothetical protein
MPHYRLYVMDSDSATIGAVEFEAADDEAAREQAKTALSDDHRGELWRQVPLEGKGRAR